MPSLSRTTTSPRRAALLALAGVALAVLLPAGPARAGAGGTDGDRQVRDLGTCRAYGSSSGFGIACAGPGGAGGRPLTSWVPAGLPRCWVEDTPEDVALPPRTGPGRWWLETCLWGIDLQTLQLAEGGLRVVQGYRFLRPGEGRVLTTDERYVVDALVSSGQVPLPFPVLDVTPSVVPRVGELVAFAVVGPVETPVLQVGGVRMQGHLRGLRVEPEGTGPGSPVVTCEGAGRRVTPEEVSRAELTGEDLGDDVCDHRYGRSSFRAGAGEDGDRYPVRVTAVWEVELSGSAPLGPFGKEAVNEVRVAEVQTLVVTGSGSR